MTCRSRRCRAIPFGPPSSRDSPSRARVGPARENSRQRAMFRPLATRIRRELLWLEREDDDTATTATVPQPTPNLGLDLHVFSPRECERYIRIDGGYGVCDFDSNFLLEGLLGDGMWAGPARAKVASGRCSAHWRLEFTGYFCCWYQRPRRPSAPPPPPLQHRCPPRTLVLIFMCFLLVNAARYIPMDHGMRCYLPPPLPPLPPLPPAPPVPSSRFRRPPRIWVLTFMCFVLVSVVRYLQIDPGGGGCDVDSSTRKSLLGERIGPSAVGGVLHVLDGDAQLLPEHIGWISRTG